MKFILRYIGRFRYAIGGVVYAIRDDFSFRWQVVLIGLVTFGVAYYQWPLTDVQLLALVLGYTLVLITELQNSALEEALDYLHPELHQRIGRTKDMAAGSVLLAGLFFVFVLLLVTLG